MNARTLRLPKRILVATICVLPAGAVVFLLRGDADATRPTAHETLPATAMGAERAPLPVVLAPALAASHGSSRAPDFGIAPPAKAPGPGSPATPATANATNADDAPMDDGISAEDALAGLRGADADEARAIFDKLVDDENGPLTDARFVEGLLALAADAGAAPEQREVALDLVGRARAADDRAVARLDALAVATDAPAEVRAWALVALRSLALDRSDLEAPVRGALLDALENAPEGAARADALEAVPLDTASASEITRLASFLADPDAAVRAGAARALAKAPANAAAAVATKLEATLGRETDADTAGALVQATLATAGSEADATLARIASLDVVKAHAELGRQVADYRASLAAGETNPLLVASEHESHESESLADGR